MRHMYGVVQGILYVHVFHLYVYMTDICAVYLINTLNYYKVCNTSYVCIHMFYILTYERNVNYATKV